MKNLTVTLLAAAALSGCFSGEVTKAAPEIVRVHTVDEYLAHPELRKKVSAVCGNDPGRTGFDANCINVRRADRMASFGSAASMPRITP
jgi:hypothetical protein